MLKCFFMSRQWITWAWLGSITLVSLIVADVYLSVLFNQWYKEFYDILQKPTDIQLFYKTFKVFFIIAFGSIIIHVCVRFLSNHFALRWRQAMIYDYIPKWSKIAEEVYEGSSQRIQEDTHSFTHLLEELGEQILRSILTLAAFIPILWPLSSYVVLPYLNFPGALVWLALLISFGGLLISWLVGIKLPGLEYNNQKVEARFRKQLVYGEDDKKWADPLTLNNLFADIRTNYTKLYLHYTYFNLWRNLYYQINIVLPYIIIAPSLFQSIITLGIVVQVSNAFGKVQHASSILLDRWTQVTELRSVYKRLKEFESVLQNKTT